MWLNVALVVAGTVLVVFAVYTDESASDGVRFPGLWRAATCLLGAAILTSQCVVTILEAVK